MVATYDIRRLAAFHCATTAVVLSGQRPRFRSSVKKRLPKLFAGIEVQSGLKAVDTWANRMTKADLEDAPLWDETLWDEGGGLRLRVETVHQVKGESIGAVLYLAKAKDVQSLLGGVKSEEGRIGYVALTRARDLFILGVPSKSVEKFKVQLDRMGLRAWGHPTRGLDRPDLVRAQAVP